MMIPFWALVHMDLYVHFFLPQVRCTIPVRLKFVWFSPIDGVISLVMRKKRVCLSKMFQMLWDHVLVKKKGFLQREFMARLYFIDWEITKYIKRNISLQSQNSRAYLDLLHPF